MLLTEERFKQKDGTFVSNIVINWTAISADQLLRLAHHLVQLSIDGGVTYKDIGLVGPDDTQYRIELGNVRNTSVTYTVRVKTISREGRQSPGTVDQITLEGKLTPPNDVVDFDVRFQYNHVSFKWAANDDADLFGYEIRMGDVGSRWETASIVITELLSNFYDLFEYFSGTKIFYIKAIDTSGNYSENADSQTVTLSHPLPGLNEQDSYIFFFQISSHTANPLMLGINEFSDDPPVLFNSGITNDPIGIYPTDDYSPNYFRPSLGPVTNPNWYGLLQQGITFQQMQESSFVFGEEKYVTDEITLTFDPPSLVALFDLWTAIPKPTLLSFIMESKTFSTSNLARFVCEINEDYTDLNSKWTVFKSGYINVNVSKVQFRFKFQIPNENVVFRFSDAVLHTILPDKTKTYYREPISSSGTTQFDLTNSGTKEFTGLKTVQILPVNGQPQYAVITDPLGQGAKFTVRLYNSSGNLVGGFVNIFALGF